MTSTTTLVRILTNEHWKQRASSSHRIKQCRQKKEHYIYSVRTGVHYSKMKL